MNERKNLYDWASYYAAACEREKKQNNMLAVKIAEAETKQEDLNQKLNRIYSNRFYKLSAPLYKLYHGIQGGMQFSKKPDRCSEEDPCLLYYKEELERQKQPYLQWIQKEEKNQTAGTVSQVMDGGIWKVPVPDTDIILVGYGAGELNQAVFRTVRDWFRENEDCMLAYADEDFYWETTKQRMEPWFKPCYSPDTLLSFNYFGHMVAIRKELAGKVTINAALEPAVSFYDFCLRLEEAAYINGSILGENVRGRIGHINAVLYHNKYEVPKDAKTQLAACNTATERFAFAAQCLKGELEQGKYLIGAGGRFNEIKGVAFARRGLHASLEPGQHPDIYHTVYDIIISGRDRCARAQHSMNAVNPQLLVSVVIPSKDHPEALEKCIRSFVLKTEYANYEFVVVDNGSSKENMQRIKEELFPKLKSECRHNGKRKDFEITYIYEPMPFNFSKMCNLGVKHANGDLILLLNDDMEIIEKDWLTRMVGQAVQPHTGAVGAKLWYAGTEKIQHAGITNLEIGPSHKLVTFQDDKNYYYGRNLVTYDMIGVTAACLLVSKAKYEQAGGMDESMAVAYNDVDFCFKLIEAGYYNVLRNDAVLYHYESLSRGLDEQDDEKWSRLLREKEKLYQKHPQMKGNDPFYHRALVDNASDYGCNFKFPYEDHLYTVTPERLKAAAIRGAEKKVLQLTVDRAEIQHKIHGEEPEILWIIGWSYVPGADNAGFKRQVILKRTDQKGYTAVPEDWHREDVEDVLPQECHIGLAGFVLRIKREELDAGEYQVGMVCKVSGGRHKLIAWSDKTVVI